MILRDLAKEVGQTNKVVGDFLQERTGRRYTHANKLDSSEVQAVRDKFAKGASPAAPPKTEEEAKKPVTTMIRRPGDARKRFVPSDERESVEEEASKESVDESESKVSEETVVASDPERDEKSDKSEITAPADESEDQKVEEKEGVEHEHEKKLRVEEEARRLLLKETEAEAVESKSDEEEKVKGEKRKIEVLDEIPDDDDSDVKKGKHKKRKVVIPETDTPTPSAVATTQRYKPKKNIKNIEQTGPALKARGKIKGPDISQFIEEPAAAQQEFRKKKRERRKAKPVVVAPPNPTKAIKKILKLEDSVQTSELARRMGIKASQLISKLMVMGEVVSINDNISYDMAQILAEEFGFTAENVTLSEETYIETCESCPDSLVPRPPVVTVMGHVDHGKTKLLDAIRQTNVVDREAGGITQHIGAYSVKLDKGTITFLDTPGHEAFTAMRSRGAQATDVVILIIAADDGVKPQTVEAISHAKAADVPIIVAINKIDKPEANPQRVKNELLKYEIVAEELGGEHLFVEISAKQRINIEELLEAVLLQVEMMDLKADPLKPAEGIVIESKMDLGKGPVATALVKDGTLKIGDLIVTGTSIGYVRSMMDWTGARVKEAAPSMAVEITGLDCVPPAGEKIHVFKDEKKAKSLVDLRANKLREKKHGKESKMSLENLFTQMELGDIQEINVVVKGDVDGSVEAIISSLNKIEHKKMSVKIIHSGVGGINENDILLASASNAIIVGFNVRVDNQAKQLAASEMVDIKIFSIIYDLIDSVKAAMTGLLAPIIKEELSGKLEVRDLFKVGKTFTIAGCMVTEGKITRGSKVKLVRENIVIYEGKLGTLKRFKDDVREVKSGYECGATIENYNDIKVGDVIESYIDKEIRDEVI
ncbi:MAG: translation initiation factor IF-2 [bacterium]